jgi:long-chain acyl-CoA synthetase
MLENLGEISSHGARTYGDRAALVIDERSFSFNEIDRLACQLANGLKAKGVEPGDRVTLYAQNCWEWVVSYHGIVKTGAVVNPINMMLTPEEVGFVANDCQAKAIVASAESGEGLMDIQADTPLDHVVLFGDGLPKGALSFNEMLEAGADSFDTPSRDREELSTICYTSGTTGHPKGAMQSHKAVISNAALTAMIHRRIHEDVVVSALPCAHVYGNVVMNGAFLYGYTFVLVPRFEETAVLGAIQEHRATLYDGVPTSYMMMLAHPDFEKYDLSSITRLTVGGQTIPVAKGQEVEERFDAPLLELWGMTELAGVGTGNAFYAENRLGSIGAALPFNACRVVDVDDPSKTLPPGEVGELMCKGPIVMQGYFGNEAGTREAIEPDGWLHTGDLCSMDEDGYYYVVDRKKDMILTAGYNIYPAEIERVLATHPAVAMSAVGRKPDEVKGEVAKAYIVLKPAASAKEKEITDFCREHLAAYKVPRDVQFVADLPKTSTGKIMRRELHTLDS